MKRIFIWTTGRRLIQVCHMLPLFDAEHVAKVNEQKPELAAERS